MSEVRVGYVSSIDYENGLCEIHYPDRDDTVTETSGETLCFASDFTVSDAATSTATYWSVQDPDGTKLTDQTITATAEETIQSTLGWLSGLFG